MFVFMETIATFGVLCTLNVWQKAIKLTLDPNKIKGLCLNLASLVDPETRRDPGEFH